MSKTSMKERNKAVRKAWEREQQLVQVGQATRDWTEEQQKDILNPDKGKAYDDQGRAFEGQHMKSAAEYPKYQGNPDNIQFLTKEEHLEAHKGSWQNPTNWYYDPDTKEFTNFGDEELIVCKVIELRSPIVELLKADSSESGNHEENNIEKTEHEKRAPAKENDNSSRQVTKKKQSVEAVPKAVIPTKMGSKFTSGLKFVGHFIAKHPVESLEIAGVLIGGTVKIVTTIAGSINNTGPKSNSSSHSTSSGSSDIVTKVADIVEKATRAIPVENDVSGHKQRYHTKSGVIWKNKAPYHRSGKN